MDKKILSILVIIAGVIVLLVSALAYPLGLGGAGFGIKQISGTVAGVLIAAAGVVPTARR